MRCCLLSLINYLKYIVKNKLIHSPTPCFTEQQILVLPFNQNTCDKTIANDGYSTFLDFLAYMSVDLQVDQVLRSEHLFEVTYITRCNKRAWPLSDVIDGILE